MPCKNHPFSWEWFILIPPYTTYVTMVTGGWCRWHCFKQKKGVYLFKSQCSWSALTAIIFQTHRLRALHSKTLVSHLKKTWQFWCYTQDMSHFQMHRKIPRACFPRGPTPCCVDPGCSHVSPGRSWKPSWKSRSVAKRTRPKACEGLGFGGELGSAGKVKSVQIIQRSWESGYGSSYIYIYIL